MILNKILEGVGFKIYIYDNGYYLIYICGILNKEFTLYGAQKMDYFASAASTDFYTIYIYSPYCPRFTFIS